MSFCPNVNDESYKEQASVLGDKAAHLLWDLNKGYPLSLDPGGSPSKLFNDLTNLTSRKDAIRLKAQVYLSTFRNEAGDWLNQETIEEPQLTQSLFDHLTLNKDAAFRTLVDTPTVNFGQDEDGLPKFLVDNSFDNDLYRFNQGGLSNVILPKMDSDEWNEYLKENLSSYNLPFYLESTDSNHSVLKVDENANAQSYHQNDPTLSFAHDIARRFNKTVETISASESSTLLGTIPKNVKAFAKGDTVYLIRDRFDKGVVLHEFAHMLTDAMEQADSEIFNRLYQEARYKPAIMRHVLDNYRDANLSESQLKREVVVAAITQAAAENTENSLVDHLLYRLSEWIGKTFGINLPLSPITPITHFAYLLNNQSVITPEMTETMFAIGDALSSKEQSSIDELFTDVEFALTQVKSILESETSYKRDSEQQDYNAALHQIKKIDDVLSTFKEEGSLHYAKALAYAVFISEELTRLGKNADNPSGALSTLSTEETERTAKKLLGAYRALNLAKYIGALQTHLAINQEFTGVDDEQRALAIQHLQSADLQRKVVEETFAKKNRENIAAALSKDSVVDQSIIEESLKMLREDPTFFEKTFGSISGSRDPVLSAFGQKIRNDVIGIQRESEVAKQQLLSIHNAGSKDFRKYLKKVPFRQWVKGKSVLKQYDAITTEFRDGELAEYLHEKKAELWAKVKAKEKGYTHKTLTEEGGYIDQLYQANFELRPNGEGMQIIEENKHLPVWRELELYSFASAQAYNSSSDPSKFEMEIINDLGETTLQYFYAKPTSARLMQPKVEWKEKNYEALSKDPVYAELVKMYSEANARMGYKLKYGILPQVRKDVSQLTNAKKVLERTYKAAVEEQLGEESKEIKEESPYSDEHRTYTLDNEVYRKIPPYYTYMLEDPQDVSTDLLKTFSLFDHQSRMFDMLRRNEFLAQTLVVASKSREELSFDRLGKPLRKKIGKKESLLYRDAVKPQADSRSHEMLTQFINEIFYGETTIDNLDPKLRKVAQTLQSVVGFTTMSLNWIGGSANAAWGLYQNTVIGRIENEFSLSNAKRAEGIVVSAFPKMIQDDFKSQNKSKLTKLLMHYDINDTFQRHQTKNLSTGGEDVRDNIVAAFMANQNLGEANIYAQAMVAKMLATPVTLKSGVVSNLWEAYGKTGELSESDWDTTKDKKFTIELSAFLRDTQGNYAALDRGTIQRYTLGRMVMMFHKHIYSQVTKRVGGKRTSWERANVVDGKTVYRTQEGYWRVALGYMMKIARNKLQNAALSTSKEEKAAAIALAVDVAFMGLMTGIAAALLPDDKDDRKNMGEGTKATYVIASLLANNAFVLRDLQTLSSSSLSRIVPPVGYVLNLLDAIGTGLEQLAYYTPLGAFMDESDVYYEHKYQDHQKGDSKFAAKLNKVIPVYRNYHKLTHLDEAVDNTTR